MILVTDEEVRAAFDWRSAIETIRASYLETPIEKAAGRVVVSSGGVGIRAMVAAPTGAFVGSKQIVRGAGGLRYLVALFDRDDAALTHLIDGLYLTSVRTSATSALALSTLVEEISDLAVLGSGQEARHHLEAVCVTTPPSSSVRVFSPRASSRDAFAAWASEHLGVEVTTFPSPEAAVEGADVVIAAARSTGEQPILYADWLESARAVVSIGSTLPHQRELDVSVIARAGLIVSDDPVELEEHTGDLIAARAAGVKPAVRIVSLSDLLSKRARPNEQGAFTLYKSIGSAIQDVAVAASVTKRLGERAHVVDFALCAR